MDSSSSNGAIKMTLAAIRMLLLLVVMGIAILWIMLPTNTYKEIWMPTLKAKFNSTYYGTQGSMFLIFIFPTLFVAVLGCVYLHFNKKTHKNNLESKSRIHLLSSLKKSVLVKGPLGIISWIELAFLLMFMALLLWSFLSYLHNCFANITPEHAALHGETVTQSKLANSGYVLGVVGNIVLAFLFFPVTRGSSILPLFGLTSEASMKYHIWLGHLAMILFTAHSVVYIILFFVTKKMSEMLEWANTGISYVAGEISFVAGLVLWATTIPRIRRKFFELFFYTHHLYILFVIFFILHVGISYSCIFLPNFYLFFLDRYLRFLQSRQSVRLFSARILPCQTVELNFTKAPGLSYNPTSIMFINVPSISKMQWHPMTITSNSNLEPENLSVVIKCEGNWSTKLYHLLSTSPIEHLGVSVEGPYGPNSTHFLRHDTLVLVSGGSGITPLISIIREMIFLSSSLRIPKIILICSFKNSSSLTMLDIVLPISSNLSAISKMELEIHAYVTRDKEPIAGDSIIQTKWFKPNASDAPISATLGPNSWLWLAAIISSSFIIFLILIGIITRYYIYPIDQNAQMIFSTSKQAVLNILFLCISIIIVASAAVYWNKEKNTVDRKRIQSTEGSSYNADKELESFPHQSIVQATRVHYGERPDLKRMILECNRSSTGVFVSGPKKMRHEVAAICSSELADNLHFESISFSW